MPHRFSASAFLALLLATTIFAGEPYASGHRGEVGALAVDQNGGDVYSAGRDGYVVRWNPETRGAAERYQIGQYPLTSIALRPGTKELAVVENDGLGLYRVSAWDFAEKKRLFTLRFRDAVAFAVYSERGSYLIVARNAFDGLVVLDARTGEKISQMHESSGLSAFAATGRSERTMLSYSRSGELSYWSIADGTRAQRIRVGANLDSVALFGGGRYFAGIAGSRLFVYDAFDGAELARRELRGTVRLLQGLTDSSLRYACADAESAALGEFSVGQDRRVAFLDEKPLHIDGAIGLGPSAARDGALYVAVPGGIAAADLRDAAPALRPLEHRVFGRISDAAAAEEGFIDLLVDSSLIRIPAAPDSFAGDSLPRFLGRYEADRISAVPGIGSILWSPAAANPPRFRFSDGSSEIIEHARGAPLLSAGGGNGTAFMLDAAGTLSVYDPILRRVVYSSASIGLIDAALVDDRRLVVAKSSAVPPFSPLVAVNYRTGETVPLPVPGKAAVRVYRGPSGMVYAIVADSDSDGAITRLVRLDPDRPTSATALLEYRAEDVQAAIAESGSSVGTTLGGDGASVFGPTGFARLERSASLPKKLIAANGYFAFVGEDGSLGWNDATSGKLIGILRFSADGWMLDGDGKQVAGKIAGFPAD